MQFDEIISHFQIQKRYGDKAQARCPCHDDKQASLTITKGRRSALIYCHAGCNFEDIIQSVGLKKQDLYFEERPPGSSWRAYVEGREKKRIEAVYNYVSSSNGEYTFTKIRMQDKRMIYGVLCNNRFSYGLSGRHRKDLKSVYGDLKALNKAIAEGKPIFVPEGEKDVDTLTKRGYTAITYGGVNDWQSDFATLFKDAEVYILADNDEPGCKIANTILSDLKGIAKSARVIVPVPDVPKADVSDYFAAGHSNEDFEKLIQSSVTDTTVGSPTSVTDTTVPKGTLVNVENVRSMLMYKVEYDKDGSEKSRKLIQNVKNFEIVLDNDGRFKGKIKYDEFSQQTYLMGSTPWETSMNNYRAWGSFDDSALFSILQSDYGLNSRNDYFDAIKNVAMRNRFHPVRDLLSSLKWDGQEHIRGLLPDYLGADDTEYTYQVWRLWMLGAVSRIFQPGCKFDYTVIFQGRQGLGKSTFLQLMALNDSWFNDSLDSLDSDKAAQSLMGSWIIELAELKSLARTAGGVDSVKRFLTAVQDKIRLPYERRADIFLRQSVFAGTTNKSDFLQDETGNRRFLIIQTGVHEPKKNLFDPEAMRDIKAAWAEAVHIYKIEKPKLLLPESCRKQAEELQAESMSDDGKIGIIQEYLSDKHRTCAIEIWQKALGEQGRPAKWQASEISNIILGLPEWERIPNPTKFGEYGSQRGFQRKTTNTLPEKDCSSKSGDCSNDFMKISESEFSELPFD
ncbi:MAG: VapE domain-containing protein [Lacrimispora saccharolytica]